MRATKEARSDDLAELGDQELLRRFTMSRDPLAFRAITQRYGSLVFGVAQRLLGDTGRAEEVAQEAFFRLLHKPESVTRSLPGWLQRTTAHLAIDAIRSDDARRQREHDYVREADTRPTCEWAEVMPHVDRALMMMPEPHREALVRHFLMGVAQATMAEEEGVSPATMSRRVHCALAQLREILRAAGVLCTLSWLAWALEARCRTAAPASLMCGLGRMSLLSGMPGLMLSGSGARAIGALVFLLMAITPRPAFAASVVLGSSAMLAHQVDRVPVKLDDACLEWRLRRAEFDGFRVGSLLDLSDQPRAWWRR